MQGTIRTKPVDRPRKRGEIRRCAAPNVVEGPVIDAECDESAAIASPATPNAQVEPESTFSSAVEPPQELALEPRIPTIEERISAAVAPAISLPSRISAGTQLELAFTDQGTQFHDEDTEETPSNSRRSSVCSYYAPSTLPCTDDMDEIEICPYWDAHESCVRLHSASGPASAGEGYSETLNIAVYSMVDSDDESHDWFVEADTESARETDDEDYFPSRFSEKHPATAVKAIDRLRQRTGLSHLAHPSLSSCGRRVNRVSVGVQVRNRPSLVIVVFFVRGLSSFCHFGKSLFFCAMARRRSVDGVLGKFCARKGLGRGRLQVRLDVRLVRRSAFYSPPVIRSFGWRHLRCPLSSCILLFVRFPELLFCILYQPFAACLTRLPCALELLNV